jgi:aminoglycoside phosphotransferase family enzyme/predicted kinase
MSLPAPIRAMLRPEMYAHAPATVELVQTHISYVLLAGTEVYKVKKPVRFSFLDFSTLERRHHFCREEVRLNRRLAPDVYHGLVAICPAGDTFRLAPEGETDAVEYAVHMRRLRAERMLDTLLDRGAVTATMIDAVARRLAAFHRAADAGPDVAANGDTAAILAILEDNYVGVRPFRGVALPSGDDDAIQAFARDFLRQHEPLFRRRQAQHRVRECHGDLHTEHVCFDPEPVIFDCIEFSRQFRYCDTASEIAFLAMDLDYHDHPDLARHLVSAYATYANDPDLPRLVPFYQCYRAYVRGKVDSLKSAEEEVEPREREQARRSARRHFALAYRYSWAYRCGLVVIAGLSGSGKSAIATALQARTGLAHINSDVLRKQLAGVAADTPMPAAYAAGLYTPAHSARTYEAMLGAARDDLGAGHGVILDATFQRRADRDAARAVAAACGVPFVLLECRCTDEEVRQRIAQRQRAGASPSDADWAVYLEQQRRFEPIAPDEAEGHFRLDATGPLNRAVLTAEQILRHALPAIAALG